MDHWTSQLLPDGSTFPPVTPDPPPPPGWVDPLDGLDDALGHRATDDTDDGDETHPAGAPDAAAEAP